MAIYDHEAGRQRGLRFAKRAGLDPATTSIEFSAESTANRDPAKRVLVKLETMLFLSREEFEALYNGTEAT